MNFAESLRTAASDLLVHKLRTTLTMLGIIFGVGAVIAMLSIGAGGEKQALESIGRLGVRNVIIRAKEIKPEDRAEVRKKSLGLSLRDGEAIEEAIPDVEVVLPRVKIDPYKVLAVGTKSKAKAFGVSWQQARDAAMPLAVGRWFDARDEREHGQVALVGSHVAQELFGGGSPVGQTLKVNDVWLEVIGVLGTAPGSSSSIEGISIGSTDQEIYLPVTTAMRKLERDPLDAPLDELIVQLKEGVSPRATSELVENLLDRLHGGEQDYEIVVPEALLEQSRRTQRIFKIVMGSIAGISLLVGGIGIMNIMLASVMERTREIGVRRAIGARKQDIRTQFVIESFAISVAGGFVGIVTGVVLARIVAAYAGWATVITVSSLLLSTGVAIAVGLASGIYPAVRASELNPIEALRYE